MSTSYRSIQNLRHRMLVPENVPVDSVALGGFDTTAGNDCYDGD